ncbi:SusC/RagA family TonB-linked outer membrane protein [Tenacibaculum sp. S7007]|uniref:SusC/RagA family TonB-linked outer membrane protein n=1 Tax=Tenacibaculum pelagium TaxID=2759527 RepID=A0A839AKG4_9FLAO|nr:SusC/RagA family TonB-linked outer membrane protein [Tenacibaculum pelagium]MBA6155593.1 SusC/RagA family TonB-linked outer membrane protein [Tenacibaculum pelagium]
MKTKFNGILTLLLALVVQMSFAQDRTISGTVSDESGPLPGVTVLKKGTTQGAETDFDGNYSIKAKTGDVLVYSFVGMKTSVRTVGASNSINVKLEEDDNILDEVVVTALGIKRNSREIGYGVTTVKAKDLTEVASTNVFNSLQAKSSGIIIKNQSGNLGGSQRIIIRGNSSLSGTVQPLFVVDGIPISNANVATGSRIQGGYDFGNRAQDINPDDVENVTILKGASAAALYGSRASGGVVLITTKKGKSNGGTKSSVTFNSSFRFDNALITPNLQTEFAPGDEGAYDFAESIGDQITPGFGPSISSLDGSTYENYSGQTVPFRAFNDRFDKFYRTGVTKINSIAFSGASSPDDTYRLSIGHTEQSGILPTANLRRLNIGLNAGKKLSEKLKSNFSVTYTNTNLFGTAAQGANNPNVLTGIINLEPITTDFDIFKNYINDVGEQLNNPSDTSNNPYWIANKNRTEARNNRFLGNFSLTYAPTDNFDVLLRAGYDNFTERRFLPNAKGTIGRINGGFTDDVFSRDEMTLDAIGTHRLSINEDLNLTTRAGVQFNDRKFQRNTNVAQNLTVPDLYDNGNAESNAPTKAFSQTRVFGVFGDLTLDYKNWLILNATARNDWSSTLFPNNNSFFYPSVSLSWVFTDALNIESNTLSYGKLRTSWANVGDDTGAYLLNFVYSPLSTFFGQFGTGGTYPFNGQLAFSSSDLNVDPNLVPANQRTFEVGAELGFFNNRLNLNATYYSNLNSDDIISVPVPQTTGFTGLLTNVGGVSNKGVELSLNGQIIKNDNFTWDFNYNFTKNTTRVESLDRLPGGSLTLASEFNGLEVRAVEGKPFQLFGRRFARAKDADGNEIEDAILVDSDGLRFEGEQGELGKIDPDFNMGLSTSFNYKGFRLSSTFDYRQGGKFFSNTIGSLRRNGLAAETVNQRSGDFIDPNTFTQPGGDGTALVPNTTVISTPQAYWSRRASSSIAEANIFDSSFIKWRELSLSYTLSKSALEKTPFSSILIAVQARNLAILHSKVDHIDPEAGLGGSSSQLDGIERGGIPTTRSFGLSLNAKF